MQASRDEIAINGRTSIVMSAWFPRSIADVRVMLAERIEIAKLGLTDEDEDIFAGRVWQLMTSSRERSIQEYERLPWVTYLGAEQRSEAFRKILVGGLTRSLIAATPKEASTDVGGTVLTELFYALSRPGTSADRLLNGPTNDVWLTPWLAWLRSHGVDYHLEAEVTAIDVKDRQISGVTVREGGVESTVTGDYYIAAVPVERMGPLVTEAMTDVDPILAGIKVLADDTRWMTGLQFYLSQRVPIVAGHVTYIETPWALTSISQAQFWTGYDLADYGDGTVRDILSVDISDWDAPGVHTTQKPAHELPARGDPGRGLGSAQGRDQQPRRRDPDRRHETRLVPRSRHLVGRHRRPGRHPRRRDGRRRRATPREQGRPLGPPTDGPHRHREPVPRLGLRPDEHEPRDDGGGQRGRPARGQRHPRRDRLVGRRLQGLADLRAVASRPAALVRRPPLCPRSALGPAPADHRPDHPRDHLGHRPVAHRAAGPGHSAG